MAGRTTGDRKTGVSTPTTETSSRWRSLALRAMQALLELLGRRYTAGRLVFRLPGGQSLHLGSGEPEATLVLQDLRSLWRILRRPELELGETYMEGRWAPAGGDLLPVLEICLRNLAQVEAQHRRSRWRLWIARRREANDDRRSRANVLHHYDRNPELYRSFLDAEMHYSCAYFAQPDMSLEDAQEAKAALIARKLDLRPGARVLDVGCGFGALALHLAARHDVQVLGVTLAEEQLRLGQARAQARGLGDRVTFRLQDYRQVEGEFDAVVSVGMFEHVGRPQYETFFRQIQKLLRPDGVALVHTIGRSGPPTVTNPWIRRHIFPGGYIPAASEMLAAVERAGLLLSDFEIWRLHYARTLEHWHRRFQAARPRLRALFDEAFCRMWEFYLQGCEASFRWGDLVVFQAQLLRDKRRLPLTRDYLYRPAEPTLPLRMTG